MPDQTRGQSNPALLWLIPVVALALGTATGTALARVRAGTEGQGSQATAAIRTDLVAFHECPGGARLGTFSQGDRAFATARSQDSSWVEVRAPGDPAARVWVLASSVVPDRSLSDLRQADSPCDRHGGDREDAQGTSAQPPGTGQPGTTPIEPSSTTTTAGAQATPSIDPNTAATESTKATTPTTTTVPSQSTTNPTGPTTTAASDSSGPAITDLGLAPGSVRENLGSGCPDTWPRTTTIRAAVTDPSGVAVVRASWTLGLTSGTKNLTGSGGNYTALLGPFSLSGVPTGSTFDLPIKLTARDVRGNQSTQQTTLTIRNC